jgi:hypothetical protein
MWHWSAGPHRFEAGTEASELQLVRVISGVVLPLELACALPLVWMEHHGPRISHQTVQFRITASVLMMPGVALGTGAVSRAPLNHDLRGDVLVAGAEP